MIQKLHDIILKNMDRYTQLSDTIWDYAEIEFDTPKSSQVLIDTLLEHGFKIEKGTDKIEHAFVAKYENGGKRIGFLGEFDALPNMSQKANALHKEAIVSGENGHGCGHNLLGVGSLTAAISLATYLQEEKLEGSVYYFGCPAEESGYGKSVMAQDGFFDGLDIALSWHPHFINETWSDRTLAVRQVNFEFKGISSHASLMPEMGRSAPDAAEIMNIGTNFLREHMPQDARIHYAFLDAGGKAANVVQDSAKLVYIIRGVDEAMVQHVYERIVKISQGAALITETQVTHEITAQAKDVIPNEALSLALDKNMRNFDFVYSDDALVENQKLSPENKKVSLTVPNFKFGNLSHVSTDVGDVSWRVPVAQSYIACEPVGTPMHSWQWVANGKSKMAHEALGYVGALLAKTGLDYIQDITLQEAIRDEFEAVMASKHSN